MDVLSDVLSEPEGQELAPDEGYDAFEDEPGLRLEAEPAHGGPAPPGYVPLAALEALRGELRGYKEELRRAQAEQDLAEAYEPPPSAAEDEDGYARYVESQLQTAALNNRLDMSEDLARARHGDEMVDYVQAWFAERGGQSPALREEVLSERNPYEHAIALMQREAVLADLDPYEFAEFRAWRAAQQDGHPDAYHPSYARAPSRSLASAASAGGVQHTPLGPGQAFDVLFRGT